jgi:uncharacterized protein
MRLISALLAALLFVGCASYQAKVQDARNDMTNGNAAKAVDILKPLAEKQGDDQLVYLLDYATALQLAGRYQDSANQFGIAEKMADIKDYKSLSRMASSLVLSEGMLQYKGDDYEKVLINGVNAINYLELGQLDDALVEVRKLNNMLYKFKYEAKRPYEQNPYAFYLSAIIWEADHKWDDAYIAYKAAYEVNPNYAPLRQDLIRAAIRADREDDLADWKKKFSEVKIDPEWNDKTMGEIILVYQQGWGPRKQPRPGSPKFPHLVPTYANTRWAKLIVENENGQSAQTKQVFSVQDVAIKTLDDDFARLVASRVAGTVTKAIIADQVAQHNQLLGYVTFLALNATDQADLRQWSTLPASFQVARLPIKAGRYKVTVHGVGVSGNESNEHMQEREVVVPPGGKAFVTWRSLK